MALDALTSALAAAGAIRQKHYGMSDKTNTSAAQAAVKKGGRRRKIVVGAILLGVPTLLWLIAACLVARSLMYPAFLYRGTGQEVFGEHVPEFQRGSVSHIATALGVAPERLDAGVVEEDGIRHRQVSVVGWYFPNKRREVVVIVPAAGATEDNLVPYVKFLLAAGYTVVANYSANNPDFGISWGLLKRKFALATARTLKADGFDKIAALGISEGAAGVIMAQAESPVFSAVVADSPYANLSALFRRSPSIARLNPAFASTVLWEAQFWFGYPLDTISPEYDAADLDCPLLIIQNRGDKVTPIVDGQAIDRAAGVNSEIWIAPSDGHGDAIYEAPKEYASRVVKFLNESFASQTTPAAKPNR